MRSPRPGRQMKEIRRRAEEFGISLPDSDNLTTLETALRTAIARRLKDIKVKSRLHYRGRPWRVTAINPAPEGRQGKIYTLRTTKGLTQVEVSEAGLLRGMLQ